MLDDPLLLVLDEPTSGLGAAAKHACSSTTNGRPAGPARAYR